MRHPLVQQGILRLSRGGLLRGFRALAWRLGAPLVAEPLAVGDHGKVHMSLDA